MKPTEILERLLKNNSPLLFLGAGFSIGGTLWNGNEFPKGDDLKDTLIKDFIGLNHDDDDYLELKSYTLSQLCQYCKNEFSQDRFNDFITDMFKNGSPAKFHYNLSEYPWRKIFTTNVDDLVETVYKSIKKDLLVQNTGRKSTLRKGCTEYIKLHGCVNNPSLGMVFSADEYVESLTKTNYGFSTLTG